MRKKSSSNQYPRKPVTPMIIATPIMSVRSVKVTRARARRRLSAASRPGRCRRAVRGRRNQAPDKPTIAGSDRPRQSSQSVIRAIVRYDDQGGRIQLPGGSTMRNIHIAVINKAHPPAIRCRLGFRPLEDAAFIAATGGVREARIAGSRAAIIVVTRPTAAPNSRRSDEGETSPKRLKTSLVVMTRNIRPRPRPTPVNSPNAVPTIPVRIASTRTISSNWRRVIPTARMRPKSSRRCVIDMAKALKIRKPAPTVMTSPTAVRPTSNCSLMNAVMALPSALSVISSVIPRLIRSEAIIVAMPTPTASAANRLRTQLRRSSRRAR